MFSKIVVILGALAFAHAQLPPVVGIDLVGLPMALPPVKLPTGVWSIKANTSTTILPQQCAMYPTGVALKNATAMYDNAVYSLEPNYPNIVLECVYYRNSTVLDAKEIIAKLCSTLLNAPVIVRSDKLLLIESKPDGNGTAPVLIKTGPYSTYGKYPVVKIATNMYLLYAEVGKSITTDQDYLTGIYLDTVMVPDPSTITYSMYPATNCNLNSNNLVGPNNEINLNLKQAAPANPCVLTEGQAMVVAVIA